MIVYSDESRTSELGVLRQLRQQSQKSKGLPNRSLADFVAPIDSGVQDYVGAFAVTAGHGVKDLVARYQADHDDYNAIMVKALADRLAEAFAELMHERVRREFWGYAPDENLDGDALIREQYRGIRPAPGYPACPDHTQKSVMWELLEADDKAGIVLTENLAMDPGASVSGLYFAHPEASYFNVGQIGRDQIEHYADRSGMSIEDLERWLGPRLNYDPESYRVEAA